MDGAVLVAAVSPQTCQPQLNAEPIAEWHSGYSDDWALTSVRNEQCKAHWSPRWSVIGLHLVIPAVCFALQYILYMEGNWVLTPSQPYDGYIMAIQYKEQKCTLSVKRKQISSVSLER